MGVLDIPRQLAIIRARVRQFADAQRAKFMLRFFRTGPGEYGDGDRFLGLRVPQVRRIAREFRSLSLADIRSLLASKWHEERLVALLILVHQFTTSKDSERRTIYNLYLASTDRINNWDLVDVTAPQIVGAYLVSRDRGPLYRLAKSKSLWERRIAIIATQFFIRRGELDETFAIAEVLIEDDQDLIHKACGWMLREAGKRDRGRLEQFLDQFVSRMPRTMLRYAIELFPHSVRKRYLKA